MLVWMFVWRVSNIKKCMLYVCYMKMTDSPHKHLSLEPFSLLISTTLLYVFLHYSCIFLVLLVFFFIPTLILHSRCHKKSSEKNYVDEIFEIDGLRSEGPWLDKNEALFVDLMDKEVANGN